MILQDVRVARQLGDEVAGLRGERRDRRGDKPPGRPGQGDRGGGMFEWDPNASATPDDGFYIATNGWTTGNGRWVRQLNGEVANVKMWGAMGNINSGVLGLGFVSSAHDDTTNIQNAINAIGGALAPGGSFQPGELLIPSGWYKVTDTIILLNLIRLRGEYSRMSHIVMPYGVNKDIIQTYNAPFPGEIRP